jgi:hypothetical protein
VEPPRGPAGSQRLQAGRPQPLAQLELDPAREFITPGESLTYTAWLVAADDSRQDVTDQTTFSIRFSAAKTSRRIRPDGSCTDNICTATKLGRHTVTGTLDLGDRTVSGTAALQVVPRHRRIGRPQQVFTKLELRPTSATIQLGEDQRYRAFAKATDRRWFDVTARTTFTFEQTDGAPSGPCPDAACRPLEEGEYTVTGTFTQPTGPSPLSATATLLVLPPSVVIEELVLKPPTATIQLPGSMTYTAIGIASDGSRHDLTAGTDFTISPDGSCARAGTQVRCTPTAEGEHTVTGSFTQRNGPSPLIAHATLLVLRPDVVIERLELQPSIATIQLGKDQPYRVIGHATDGSTPDLTTVTEFTIEQNGKLSGSCVRDGKPVRCTPNSLGEHTVTGTFTQSNGPSPLIAHATLLVVDKIFTKLRLEPGESTILVGHGGQDYTAIATATDGTEQVVTAATTFTFQKAGSPTRPCTGAICDPPEVGTYTITGRFTQPDGPTLEATTTLTVVPPDVVITELELPREARIRLSESQDYQAFGYDTNDQRYGLTRVTEFTFQQIDGAPSGTCPDARCRPPEVGTYTITGRFTQPDGPTLEATTTLTVVPPDVVITELELRPDPKVITLGEKVTYTATGRGSDDKNHDVTAGTTFTFEQTDGPSFGPCPNATCSPPVPGQYRITGSFTQPTGLSPLVAHATLLVRRPGVVIERLELRPDPKVITLGERVTYTVHGMDANGKPLTGLGDLAAFTRFQILESGSCTDATCTPDKAGRNTVIGTLIADPKIRGSARLLVVPPPPQLSTLGLQPNQKAITLGGSVTYTVQGLDANGKALVELGDLAPFSHFDIHPDGSCTGATCTATELGRHIVRATLDLGDGQVTGRATLLVVPEDLAGLELHPKPNPAVINPGGKVTYRVHAMDTSGNHLDQLGDLAPFTSFKIDGGGSCTGATCTATKLGRHIVIATLNIGDRDVTGKATLRITIVPLHCTPSTRDVRDLQVTPGKGRPGTQVQITAQITRRFGACSVRVFLDGSQPGGDTVVGPDGNLSVRRTVPNDAKPGITTVRLATTSGRTLATTSFEVLPKTEAAVATPADRGLPWLLLLLLLLLLAVPALLRERARRQRRWVRHHFRAEPHPSADDVTSLEEDPDSAPSFSFRLQPHGDAGTQTLKEGD